MSLTIRVLFIAFVLTVLAACKLTSPAHSSNESNQNAQHITVYTIDGNKSLVKVTDTEKVQSIIDTINNREKVMLKRLPLFKYIVEVTNGVDSQRWLLSKDGIIQPEGIKGTDLHRIDNPDAIFKLL